MKKGKKYNSTLDLRCCDNMELMKEIPDNKLDLIYCDILYGTGRNFKDFQDLKAKRDIIEEHYLPRITEMYRILKDTGSIYLQMDTKINHWLRCILDDVFGYDNFRNEIIWNYKRWCGKSDNKFQNMHDNILFYSKGSNKLQIEKELIEKPKLYQNRKGKNGDVIRNKDGSVKYFPQYERLIDDVWDIDILNPRSKERVGYATQKPKKLIERIIKSSSQVGDLVGDFYAGSFTTAEVCQDLNRNFIGCDISSKAYQIGKRRLNI